jgi:hypothetical protein
MLLSIKEKLATSFIISLFVLSNDFSAQTTLVLELRTEIRAPDKWEMVWDIATGDSKIVGVFMEHYRKDGYLELQKEYILFCKCSKVWEDMAAKRDLPPSAAYIPLKLNYSLKPCVEAESLFNEMISFSEDAGNHISDLKNLYGKKEGFNSFLYDLRVFVRMIENNDVRPFATVVSHNAHIEHRIVSGETLYSISMLYKVSISKIQNANGMGDSTVINVGQKLRIPN